MSEPIEIPDQFMKNIEEISVARDLACKGIQNKIENYSRLSFLIALIAGLGSFGLMNNIEGFLGIGLTVGLLFLAGYIASSFTIKIQKQVRFYSMVETLAFTQILDQIMRQEGDESTTTDTGQSEGLPTMQAPPGTN